MLSGGGFGCISFGWPGVQSIKTSGFDVVHPIVTVCTVTRYWLIRMEWNGMECDAMRLQWLEIRIQIEVMRLLLCCTAVVLILSLDPFTWGISIKVGCGDGQMMYDCATKETIVSVCVSGVVVSLWCLESFRSQEFRPNILDAELIFVPRLDQGNASPRIKFLPRTPPGPECVYRSPYDYMLNKSNIGCEFNRNRHCYSWGCQKIWHRPNANCTNSETSNLPTKLI